MIESEGGTDMLKYTATIGGEKYRAMVLPGQKVLLFCGDNCLGESRMWPNQTLGEVMAKIIAEASPRRRKQPM